MVVSPIDNLLHFLYALGRERGRGNNIPREEEEYVDHHSSESHAVAAAATASHKTTAAAEAEITMTRRFFDFDSQIEQNERKSNGFPIYSKGDKNRPTAHRRREWTKYEYVLDLLKSELKIGYKLGKI